MINDELKSFTSSIQVFQPAEKLNYACLIPELEQIERKDEPRQPKGYPRRVKRLPRQPKDYPRE